MQCESAGDVRAKPPLRSWKCGSRRLLRNKSRGLRCIASELRKGGKESGSRCTAYTCWQEAGSRSYELAGSWEH